MPTTISTNRPAMALTKYVVMQGYYPSDGGSWGGGYIGYVRTFAGNFPIGSGAYALGQLLPISQNMALFSLLGNNYGGNGTTTYALPNLGGRVTIGSEQAPGLTNYSFAESQDDFDSYLTASQLPNGYGGGAATVTDEDGFMATRFFINVDGLFPSNGSGGSSAEYIGMIWETAFSREPDGWMPCEGQLLSVDEYGALYALIGTTYGGDGVNTFALPDLRGRAIVGKDSTHPIGTAYGDETITITQANMPTNMGGLGQAIDHTNPSLALTYAICVSGYFPPRDNGSPDSDTTYIGEIFAFAHDVLPSGFVRCEGQTLPINQNQALFSILGTTYGGNGTTTFQLPDLRGRAVMGTDNYNYQLGGVYGSNTLYLTSANMPVMNYSGTSGDDDLYGGDANDIIRGGAGNDKFRTNAGSDTMYGQSGDDNYWVDVGDVVSEDMEGNGDDGGYDRVSSWASYTLPQYVERLYLMGSALNGTGNDLVNVIYGNALNNVIDGKAGIDSMIGGLGNDTYYVDETTETISENSGEGTDSVIASVSYRLAANVENLTLEGTANNYGYGNASNNTITGNSGANTLNGFAGADTLYGKGGDDTYLVDDAGDVVREDSTLGIDDGGIDRVNSSVTFTLPAFVERLTLTGTGNINGTGNALNNTIVGNTGNNVITGGLGDDNLQGKEGDDTYVFSGNFGSDVITEVSGNDTIQFVGYTAADIITQVSGANLYIGIKELAFPARTASQVANRIRINGGASTPIENIVYVSAAPAQPVMAAGLSQAMVSFSPSAGVQKLQSRETVVMAKDLLSAKNQSLF